MQLSKTTNSIQLTAEETGKTVKLQVSAINEVGESLLSTARMVKFAFIPSAPASLDLTPKAFPASILA
jgi:hypothetical protein